MTPTPGEEAHAQQSAPFRVFSSLVSGMNATGSCWIVVLMLLINAEAISRSAINEPIIGVIEMIEISIIGIVFLQLADSLRQGILTRSDGLFNQVMRRRPSAGHCMGVVTCVLGAVFMGIVLWGSVPFFFEAWENDYYIGVDGMFTAPVWPVALIIVFGVVVTMAQFVVMILDHWRGISGRN